MKFLSSDFLAISIGVTIISIFSFLFYADITKRVKSGAAEEVGHITFKRKTAQRKYSTQVVWEDIQQKAILYNNDSIRTADMSEAVIHLEDGTEIALNENSMILLALTKDNIDIEFSHGSILANRGGVEGAGIKNLNIKSGMAVVSIAKSDVKLDQGKGQDLNLSVRTGTADVNTGAGAKSVDPNQRVVVAKDSNDVMVYKLNLKLKSPAPNRYYITSTDKKRIDFSWEPVEGEHDVFLELSKSSLFKDIFVKQKAAQDSRSVKLSKGTYYWRLRSVNRITKKTEKSDSRRLNILYDDPLQLISPKNNAMYSYRTTLPIIKFKWSKSEIATGYKLILSKDESISNILRTIKVTDNSYLVDFLKKGTYYWKIDKLIEFSGLSHTSSSKIFKLIIDEKDIVDSPVLQYPVNNKRISRMQLQKQNVTFTWKNDIQVRESKFYLARDNDFENIIFSTNSRVNFLQYNDDLSEGRYYWRVVGILEDKEKTAPSNASSFSVIKAGLIKLILPEKNAVIAPKEDERYASVRFSWKRSEIKGKLQLQISRDDSFSSIYKESVEDTYSRIIPDIKAGRYYWKVALLDDDNAVLLTSKPQAMVIKDKLVAPGIIHPADGYVVNMSDEDALSLDWKRLKGANLYRVELYHIKDGKEHSVINEEISKNTYLIDDLKKLNVGKFMWTLQAFDKNEKNNIIRKSPQIKTYFTISLGKPMKKPNLGTLKINSSD